MKEMSVREARESFAALLKQVEQEGEEVTILRYGKPVARVTRYQQTAAVPFISRAPLRDSLTTMRETDAEIIRALRDEDERF